MKIRAANDTRSYFESAVFNSFKLFAPVASNVVEKNTTPKTKIVKQPSLEDAFTTKEIVFDKPQVKAEPKKVDVKEVILPQNNEDIFFQIAYNTTKKTLDRANKFLEEVQSSHDKYLQPLSLATKIKCASTNGIVVLFEDEADAEIFMHSTTPNFLNTVKKLIGQYVHILGYDKEALDKLIQKFLILKKQGNTFNEPDIEPLSVKADTQKSLNQDLRNIFGNE
ncbi:hypothetical protein FACS1894166_02260 [Bacilli bacterium]|nr:hypothetical protein FACS1894166_02260 [Bacilli bacterium]